MTVFRIRGQEVKESSPVVFFQHGMFDSADSWIINEPDKAPAFMLVRKGYDVWLGNQRGTKYSRTHKTLNPEHDHSYWRFSFPEMGRYDARA